VASELLTDAQIAHLRTTFTQPPTGNWCIGDALACITSLAALYPRLLDEVTRARALLREIEWRGEAGHWEIGGCPKCGEEEANGHLAGCELAALLGHKKSATEPKLDGTASP
jgi:hypothetical protein